MTRDRIIGRVLHENTSAPIGNLGSALVRAAREYKTFPANVDAKPHTRHGRDTAYRTERMRRPFGTMRKGDN